MTVCKAINGVIAVPWIAKYFEECAYSDVQIISVFVGLSSIGCWLFAQVPQMIKNYKLKRAEALSVFFLGQWIMGDSANLIGCFLTHQNATQTYTAIYFVTMDVCLLSQYLYYQRKSKKKRESVFHGENYATESTKDAKIFVILLVLIVNIGYFSSRSGLFESDSIEVNGRSLLASKVKSSDQGIEYILGQIIGAISAICYLGSRIPQLVRNFRRKSTEGLSPVMFTMAVLGNVTYSASIFMYSQDPEYLLQRTSWIIGSAGTLCFDATALLQFKIYEVESEDEDDGEYQKQINSSVKDDPIMSTPLFPKTNLHHRKAYYGRIGLVMPGN